MNGSSPRNYSLVVGQRVVSRCDDGPLVAEYALFDRAEVMLTADGSARGVAETGYLTTAGLARARLEQAQVTADVAHAALDALRATGFLPRLVRSPAIVTVLGEIGPLEAFEGGRYVAADGTYTGTWLHLDTVARACPSGEAATLLQILHLLLVLEEVREDAPVRLLTGGDGDYGRPGERTWRRVPLHNVHKVPEWLAAMNAPPLRDAADEAEVREELLRTLKARSIASAIAQPRLHTLAARLARTGTTPPLGFKPTRETLMEELRWDAELLRSDAHLREVAQFLSAMTERSGSGELTLLAARAWLAAGEHGHARHFARRLLAERTAADDVRLAALEILEATQSQGSEPPPPPPPEAEPIKPSPVIVIAEVEALAIPDRPAPVGASLPPIAPNTPPLDVEPDTERMPDPPPMTPRVRFVATPNRRPEIVETLSTPEGVDERILVPGVLPKTVDEVRVAMTRLSRDLGRSYRLWYGTTLKTDVMAIDAMQRHLRRRFADPPADEKHARRLELELTRHGALLSEILARSLGAQWAVGDFSSQPPGHWAMLVPPGVGVWPIGRMYRFYRQGHRESDLVAFYMELERHAKQALR